MSGLRGGGPGRIGLMAEPGERGAVVPQPGDQLITQPPGSRPLSLRLSLAVLVSLSRFRP
jgi:hypothetical protein